MNNFSNISILIPAFNPDNNLRVLINELLIYEWKEIVVVDDGSLIESKKILHDIEKIIGVHVLTHENNKGKGEALKTGIKHIKKNKNSLKGLITVDADGQHLVTDVVKIASFINNENDVIFGVREFGDNTPLASKIGNKTIRLLLNFFNNIDINDTQTGLRYLPSSIFDKLLRLPGKRYEYELECIFAIKEMGRKILQIKIETIYLDNNSNSHFKGFSDSVKVLLSFFRFGFSSLAGFTVDILIFSMLILNSVSIFYAVAISRIVSGFLNFSLNDKIVFKGGGDKKYKFKLYSYIVLWVVLLLISIVLVSLLTPKDDISMAILVKIFVDLFLFVFSFFIQKNIIFRSG
jgi:glycosyltransferase involved in cell wall biosynthesis